MAPQTRDVQIRRPAAPKFGAHMSIAGGCDQAVVRTMHCAAVQLFTKNNSQWNAPALSAAQAAAFRSALEETGITGPVAHTSYLINLGSPDPVLWRKSIDAMTLEVEQCASWG